MVGQRFPGVSVKEAVSPLKGVTGADKTLRRE
jgi:hypothetical protein